MAPFPVSHAEKGTKRSLIHTTGGNFPKTSKKAYPVSPASGGQNPKRQCRVRSGLGIAPSRCMTSPARRRPSTGAPSTRTRRPAWTGPDVTGSSRNPQIAMGVSMNRACLPYWDQCRRMQGGGEESVVVRSFAGTFSLGELPKAGCWSKCRPDFVGLRGPCCTSIIW